MLENKIFKPAFIIPPCDPDGTVAWQAQELLRYFTSLWWDCDSARPVLPSGGTFKEKRVREHLLNKLTDALLHELKHIPANPAECQAVHERIFAAASDYARTQLGFTDNHLQLIRSRRFFELAAEFARKAHDFNPHLSDQDIYQANRNVMTMNFIQMLLDVPVEVTPSVFAYSMLYPYTDNYLDDPEIPRQAKAAFNHRFQLRLQGEAIPANNAYEDAIYALVAMVEGEWERSSHPLVYESLLVIHAAQVHSLQLLHKRTPPYDVDILGITFDKGGTSVLADGYLVAGELTQPQAGFLFGYGAFTQLMDDLEDIDNDSRDGQMTIFSQSAGRWSLDALTNRTIHFGHKVFNLMDCFTSQDANTLHDFLTRCIDPLLIDSAGQAKRYYTPAYLATLETNLPFHYAFLGKLRRKFSHHKISMIDLVRLFG